VGNAPPPARRPVRSDGRRNYDAILRVARESFQANGSTASLEEIAAGAGVAVGTLYGHFATRESLIEATTRDGLTALLAHGERVAAGDDPLGALMDWTCEAVLFSSTFRGLAEVLAHGLRDEDSHWHAGCLAMERCGADLLRAAQDAGRVRGDLTPRELFNLISAAAWVREASPAAADDSGRLLELFVGGIARP